MPFKIPAILLEGDEPRPAPSVGPGQKFDLGVDKPGEAENQAPESSATPTLPEAYGTKELWVVAREPHTLYAQWDLSTEQEQRHSSLAADNLLCLRLHDAAGPTQPPGEVTVRSGVRHCFMHVDRAGASYLLDLGYYDQNRQWTSVARSGPVSTPAGAVSDERSVAWTRFGADENTGVLADQPAPASDRSRVPFAPPLPPLPAPWTPDRDLLDLKGPSAAQGLPQDLDFFQLAGDFAGISDEVRLELLQTPLPAATERWSAEQEQALARIIGRALAYRSWPSSMEILSLIEGRELSSIGISSAFLGQQPWEKGFWFAVNAELVVYGATEPSAAVVLAGQPVSLRPDGTFSCRFALPDGRHQLPAAATSCHGEVRRIELSFTRQTEA